MFENQIESIIKHFAAAFDIEYVPNTPKVYTKKLVLRDFINNLKSKAEEKGFLIIENKAKVQQLKSIVDNNDFPVVYFFEKEDEIIPIIDGKNHKKGTDYTFEVNTDGKFKKRNGRVIFKQEEVIVLTAFPLETISKESLQADIEHLTPLERLISLLKMERKDIVSIYTYAILIGAISLVLPLGIQAIVGMVQGGLVFSSIYVLIGLVIVALVISGVMQIMQLTLVEYLQERLFAKAAFDFTFRIPRIKAEALFKYYPPELLNRFFDIITVQKTLPKLLIDVTAAIIQIIFGLLLLAAYHPLFIALTLLTIILFYIIIKLYSSSTLDANIVKSKYKYKIAQWLQDVARLHYSFKVSGSNRFPMEKTEKLVGGYLKYRKKYFDSLLIFFYNAVLFKALITGGLLILGTYLVIDRQITIGQFVASEIVIVLVVSSIEKILLSVDSIFDLLTAVDKLGYVSDMPLETNNGTVKHLKFSENAIGVKIRNLSYKFDDLNKPTINGLNLDVIPNENLCIAGNNGSGKETLLNVLAGIYTTYSGSISFNGISLRDIERDHLHETIERNVSQEGIFDGTLLENISMNRYNVSIEDVYWVLEKLELLDSIAQLKDGLNTQMVSGGRRFSKSFITKITLARCIVNRPKLLMISNCYESLDNDYIKNFLTFVTDKSNPWTLITVSNDPLVLSMCNKIAVLEEGRFIVEGTYEELKSDEHLIRCISK